MTLNIHVHAAGLEHIANLNLRVDSPSKHRPDSREELCSLCALCHVVVCPDFKTPNFVERTLFCAVHDDANVRGFSDHLADVIAVNLRQHEVEQNQVWVFGFELA